MEFRLQFEGIRCFVEKQEAVIRPLTLLVGENSSGKTTLLAICQVASSLFSDSVMMGKPVSFNEQPFLLGAFDQIVSFRGDRAERGRSFCISIVMEDDDPTILSVCFAEKDGQPDIKSARVSAGGKVVEAAPPWLGRQRVPAGVLRLLRTAGGIVALAPVRSSPRRTYDPTTVLEEPEGSHVPMLLAQLSRREAEWNEFKTALGEIGASSGLFDEIEIIRKGYSSGDPFQIGVKSSSRMFNLVDVGYGVSQVLPLLVSALERYGDADTFLIQQPEVHLHPKAQAALGTFFAKQLIGRNRFVVETHSDYLVDRVRMEIRRKTISAKDVSLLYFERRKHDSVIHHLELDDQGSIIDPPDGYRQFFLDEQRALLDF